jgi:hypothetical protein
MSITHAAGTMQMKPTHQLEYYLHDRSTLSNTCTIARQALKLLVPAIGNTGDSIVLHQHTRVDEILKWMKGQFLDAYLASVDVIIEQHDEPG